MLYKSEIRFSLSFGLDWDIIYSEFSYFPTARHFIAYKVDIVSSNFNNMLGNEIITVVLSNPIANLIARGSIKIKVYIHTVDIL